jgi:triosephosphate isomerase (TIM)
MSSTSDQPQQPRPRRIVGVSLKMYFSAHRTLCYVQGVQALLVRETGLDDIDVFILPDFLSIPSAVEPETARPWPLKAMIGAQDCSDDDQGAHTGSVSPAVLAEVGAEIVCVGHAERRRDFGETDATTAAKARACVRNGLIPLICVGELHQPDEVSAAAEAVKSQVERCLEGVPEDAEVILAYEPVWAIGAAEPAAAEHVIAVVKEMRASAAVRLRKNVTRIVYGGSAGPGTFGRLKEAVDGLFLGRFAHKPETFVDTVIEIATA